MRNLGLALLFVGMILVPHAAQAKKHDHKKGSRAGRSHPQPKHHADRTARAQPSELETAVAQKRAQADAQPTAVAPPSPNEPVNMSNQDLDDEVPGSRKKK